MVKEIYLQQYNKRQNSDGAGRTIVGVLRGGPSNEYDVSLKTGGSVLQHLPEQKYNVKDILIDKAGVWHHRGMPTEPARILPQVDVIFNALHGEYGEDGTVQKVLDMFGIPYTGSGGLSSAVAMNKHLAKQGLESYDIKLPKHVVLEVTDDLEDKIFEIFRKHPAPFVVKPLTGGSSVGVTIANGHDDLLKGVYSAFQHSKKVMIEEFIRGKEATCGVVENFRNEELYSLLPIEIVPPKKSDFFDYDAKYSGESEEICPGNFSVEEKEELQRLAKEIHETLRLKHYSRSDFIVSPEGIYFLEVNTLPGLTEESLIPKALEAIGCSFPEFLDHLVMLAYQKR